MAEWEYKVFWEETLNIIRNEKNEQEFAMWFNIEYLRATEKEIIVAVPSTFYRDQVKQRYQNYIESTIKNLTGKKISLAYEIRPRNPTEPEPNPKKSQIPSPRTAGREAAIPVSDNKKNDHKDLNMDYTFDKYIIGDNNRFAASAAMAISKNPGTSYNPFFIYGGVGLGKTHLMQAIGNYIHENSDKKIIYITAESFTNEFIHTLQENRMGMTGFKNKYRYVDVLLIDDIHFFENKWETQEELFHTFNALYGSKKQIVFTCDRPASEMKKINERLRSRFECGLNVDLQPPNYETRCAILKKKIENRRISIPDEVIFLISKNISTNIRDLEAALTKLIAYAELVEKPITVDTSLQILKDLLTAPKQTNISIDSIIRVTADYFSLSPTDIKGKKRTQKIVFPRQLAMYITRSITEFSTTEIGQDFGGRDHTTVMHSCEKVEERIKSDPTMESTIQTLIRMIKEYNAKT
ncbi:MAG: chromosomal replication initiator protein DnaA [Treponema sp.]|jgi:chromosomal replication initiator protein|nr:chromosomal replication initiator protein DnaA [Treponema sp.]